MEILRGASSTWLGGTGWMGIQWGVRKKRKEGRDDVGKGEKGERDHVRTCGLRGGDGETGIRMMPALKLFVEYEAVRTIKGSEDIALQLVRRKGRRNG